MVNQCYSTSFLSKLRDSLSSKIDSLINLKLRVVKDLEVTRGGNQYKNLIR